MQKYIVPYWALKPSKWDFIQEYEKSIGKCAKIRYVYLYMDLRRTLKLFQFFFIPLIFLFLWLLAFGERTEMEKSSMKWEKREEKNISNIAMDSLSSIRWTIYGKERKNRKKEWHLQFVFCLWCLLACWETMVLKLVKEKKVPYILRVMSS